MMQHQYWVTKKSVQRKLGGREDDCIVSSDAELDAKLELFHSVSESCVQLQRIIDLYQERLCYLAQEENALGRYLKECGKNEKNANAGQIMSSAGKALAYTSHQRLTVRPPLVRLHHEVETFRGRAISDTRITVLEMEKARTEYRAALSWMKSVSSQLDPDTGHGLERFRKAQTYVKSSKVRFDRLMLACLQKVDLLAAARCNMFSHALIPYQSAISSFSSKAAETLALAVTKLKNVEPFEFCVVSELATPNDKEEKDKTTFFNAEYTDNKQEDSQENKNEVAQDNTADENLLGDFSLPTPLKQEEEIQTDDKALSNVTLLEMNLSTDHDLLKDFLPSQLLQESNFNFNLCEANNQSTTKDFNTSSKKMKTTERSEAHVSWLSLFKELDPLANQENGNLTITDAGDRA